MISRAALARNICLRCQLRLLDRPRAHSSLRIPPVRSEFLQRRQYSSQSAWDRLEADSRELKHDERRDSSRQNGNSLEDVPSQMPAEPPSSQATAVNSASHRQDETEFVPVASTKQKSEEQIGPLIFKKYDPKERRDFKRIGARGVYLQTEHLETEQLGAKARTIVMRELPKRYTSNIPVEVLETPEKVNLLAELEREAGELTAEEALSNLDELRPSDPILFQQDFEELLGVLVNGFTTSQLRRYLIQASTTALKPSAKTKVEYSWIEEQLPWTPLQKLEITGTPKQRLGITLMREAWKLELREMVDGPGTYSAKARPQFLALLAKDSKRLTSIKETYLDPGEKIQLSMSRLRIIATKAKTDTILKKLDEVAQDMVVHDFQANWIPTNVINARLLEHLSRLTNTIITPIPTRKQIRVSWFKNGSSDEGHERLDNVVQRLLYTALYPRDASIAFKYPKATQGRLVPEALGREKLSWLDKLTPWSRWVEPTSRLSSYESDIPLKVGDVLPRPLQAPPQDFDEAWSKPYTTTTASFGHILHKHTPNFSLADAAMNDNHIFSPVSPPPAGLAALSNIVTSSKPVATSLILTFRPHPTCGKKLASDLPGLLELHITVPDDLPEGPLSWDVCPKSLVAVLSQNFTDIAYPSQPIDLRFSQPVLAAMSPSALDNSPFREYIESAQLDLLAGRLGPPPEITLSDLPSSDGGRTISKPAKYMFTGLEMRRTLDADYDGHKLRYTSIQAGHHGGRRAELVLEASAPDASLSTEETTAHAEKYLRWVRGLAHGDVVQWIGERDFAAESSGPGRKLPGEVEKVGFAPAKIAAAQV